MLIYLETGMQYEQFWHSWFLFRGNVKDSDSMKAKTVLKFFYWQFLGNHKLQPFHSDSGKKITHIFGVKQMQQKTGIWETNVAGIGRFFSGWLDDWGQNNSWSNNLQTGQLAHQKKLMHWSIHGLCWVALVSKYDKN